MLLGVVWSSREAGSTDVRGRPRLFFGFGLRNSNSAFHPGGNFRVIWDVCLG